MRRFYVAPELLRQEQFELPTETLQHLKVLRLAPGDQIELFDGCGMLAESVITALHKNSGQVNVLERRQADPEPFALRLIQGIPKGNKMDLILQKGTELGITRFTPVFCRNGDVMPAGTRTSGGRDARWQKIIQEATRQAGRAYLPLLDDPVALQDLLPQVNDELRLVPWEQGVEPLQSRLPEQPPQSVAFLIGPEGGLTAVEVGLAGQAGFQTVSLGRRILRSETAGIAVASILQYLFGDLGSNPGGRPPST
jgi:16S rRNA (uracil1498-N3)-methyltransferase